jgi:carbon storage regulator
VGVTLSRKNGESIFCGDVIVRVVKCSGGRVSLNIEAPKNVKILRSELVEKDQHNGKEEVSE